MKTAPLPEKLTAKNSYLFLATQAPEGGKYDDEGALAIKLRAKSWDHARLICKARGIRLDGIFIASHKRNQVGWHVRKGKSSRGGTLYKLYFFDRLIETDKSQSKKHRYYTICQFLNKRKAHPLELCAGDYDNIDTALKKFTK